MNQLNANFLLSQLPSPFENFFVGREQEIQALSAHFGKMRRLAQITGIRGTGKTSLAQVFSSRSKAIFPGGVKFTHMSRTASLRKLIDPAHLVNDKTLLVIDDLEFADKQEIEFIPQVLSEYPNLNILLIGGTPLKFPNTDILSISLKGLSEVEFLEMVRRRLNLASHDTSLISELFRRVHGNPLLAASASQSVREGILSLRQFLLGINEFDYKAILGPDGKPFGKGLVVPKKIVVAVTAVNAELLARLKSEPELLRSLSPRKFEEVVAELLERQGYDIELTQVSRDGGFDMYAAKNDTLGQFLYLVECKKYSPPNKVGVQVVRHLHGVVQHKRATAGIVATTSFFTDAATEFQQEIKHQLQLRDYVEMQKWLGLIK
jgi:restriction system protein